jgi:outer membrane protein OmpA-like peptidoglycan-associated protein
VLVACGGDDGDAVRERVPEALHAVDPDEQIAEIFDVLQRIELAVRRSDPALLVASVAPGYTEVACHARRYDDRAAAASARLRRGANKAWTVTLSNDLAMAWAISTGSPTVNLEVFERRGDAWLLVAGGISAAAPACDAPAGSRPISVPPSASSTLTLAVDAPRVWCGRWRDNEDASQKDWSDDDDDLVSKLDLDRDGTDDFTQSAPPTPTSGHMAWRVGPSSLAIVERRAAGWQIAASLLAAEVCEEQPSKRRGRVVVTTTTVEVLDKVYFEANDASIKPAQGPTLDAIASTLEGNPDVRVIGLLSHADPGERDPFTLSEQRGLAVREYLRGKGIAVDRLEVHFFGNAAPSGKDAAANRRVEFLIIKRNKN